MTTALGLYLRNRPAWMENGACIGGVDPDLFFPRTDGDKRIAKAKVICDSCPVTFECLTYALDTYQMGVWGGTTDTERKDIRADVRHS